MFRPASEPDGSQTSAHGSNRPLEPLRIIAIMIRNATQPNETERPSERLGPFSSGGFNCELGSGIHFCAPKTSASSAECDKNQLASAGKLARLLVAVR